MATQKTEAYAAALKILGQVVESLDYLNTDANLSESIKMLREAMLHGLNRTHDTAEHYLELGPPLDAATETDPARIKAANIWTLKSLLARVSEFLDAHRWSDRITDALGKPRAEGEPFAERRTGGNFQVLQLEKFINSLYHAQLALEAIQSEDLRDFLDDAEAVRLFYEQKDVEDPVELEAKAEPEQAAQDAPAKPTSWWQNMTNYVGETVQWSRRKVYENVPGAHYIDSSAHYVGERLESFGLWVGAVKERFGGPLARATGRGELVRVIKQANTVVNHGHRACELLTEIDAEFLGALAPELKWFTEQFKSKGVGGVLTWLGDFFNRTPEEFAQKSGYFLGLMLDQLRPVSEGGASFPLLSHLTALAGEGLEANTSYIDTLFEGSSDIFSHFNVLAAESGLSPKVLQAFGVVTQQARSDANEEKARLRELNQIAAKLAKSFGDSGSESISFIRYFSIAWYTIDLISKVKERAEGLTERSKLAIKIILVGLRDHYCAELIAFCDKLDEALLTHPELSSISEWAIAQLKLVYNPIVTHDAVNAFVELEKLGNFESKAFKQHRINAARKRRQQYLKEAREVDTLLIPALDMLFARLEAPIPKAEDLPKLFVLLKPHIEAVDPAVSQDMLNRWFKTGEYLKEPDHYFMHHDQYQAIRIRLERVQQSRLLSAQLAGDILTHIKPYATRRACIRQRFLDAAGAEQAARVLEQELPKIKVKYDELNHTVSVDGEVIKAVSVRRAAGYLVWHAADTTLEQVSDESLPMLIQKALRNFDSGMKTLLPHDTESKQDSPMNITFISEMLDHVVTSLEQVQGIQKVDPFSTWVRIGPEVLQTDKYKYVGQTIATFHGLVMAVMRANPYIGEVSTQYKGLADKASDLTTTLLKPYEGIEEQPIYYRAMYFILVAPKHIESLAKGQPQVYFDKSVVDQEARVFSNEVQRLIQHVNYEYSIVRYPVLLFDALGLLFGRLFANDTFDQKAQFAIKALCSAIYNKVVKEGIGIRALNEQVGFNLLRYFDGLEQRLVIEQGAMTDRIEVLADEFMENFLEPLSAPSELYHKTLVNESSSQKRYEQLPASSPHAVAFQEKVKQRQAGRQEKYWEKTIDRALVLELMRIRKEKQFGLKYANDLYLEALRKTLRPLMQQEIRGKGGVSQPVFWKMYKPHENGLNALSAFDKPRDGQKPQVGTVRLDAVRKSITALEAYLCEQGFWFKLFETDETLTQKWQLLGKLKAFAEDETKPPSERIQALHELIHTHADEENKVEFTKALQAQSSGLSVAGMKRAFVWLASCFNFCKYDNPSLTILDELLHAVSPHTTELQVFDKLYAKDYRRLDAMLEQIKALESYLEDLKRNQKGSISDKYENDETYSKKLAWIKHLRKLAETTEKTPEARIKEMRQAMMQPAFTDDMLRYKKVENWLSFEGFKRAILWLLSCVGLYSSPVLTEHKALMHAADERTQYDKSPLIDMGWFKEHASEDDRNYTPESALDKLRFKKPQG